jgi:hypothetical protein
MVSNQNPSAKAGETDIITARREAAAKLLPLFGGTIADGKEVVGAFHTYGIAAVIDSGAENKKLVDELRSNPHAKTLAVVLAARGNKNFPPALVAELFSRPEVDEDNDWFAKVFLSGLAEIFAATGVGLMLPPAQAGLDMVRGAYNVVSHLSDEERKRLGLCEADEVPRRQLAVDLMAILDEERPAPLTPAQQLYRWAVRKWDARQVRRDANAAANDAAAALPSATLASPRFNLEPEIPKEISGATIPILAVGSPQSTAPLAVEAKPIVPAVLTAEDEDRELVLTAIRKAADGGNVVAKAFLVVMNEKTTLEEMVRFATRKGLL